MKRLPANKQKKLCENELLLIEKERQKGIKKRRDKNIKRKLLKKSNEVRETKEELRLRVLKTLFPEKTFS